jgi:hypothetical protein
MKGIEKNLNPPCEVVPLRVDFSKIAAVAMETT